MGRGDGEGDAGRRVSSNRMAYAVILDFGPQTVEESLLNIDEASPTPSPRRLQLLQNGWGGEGGADPKKGTNGDSAKEPRPSSISRPSPILYSNKVYSFCF